MPSELPTKTVDQARAAIIFAQQVRKIHARRTDTRSPQRQRDIEDALARLRTAMSPLKQMIGRFPYGPQTSVAERNRQTIRDLSADIQRERRKLWKMRPKEPLNA